MDRGLVLLLATAACGRFGFEPSSAAFDARPDVPADYCATATFGNPAASTFTEAFSSPSWFENVPGCAAINTSEVVMAPPSDPPGYCFVAASVDLHLSCSSLSVRVPEVTALVLRAQTFIYVSSGNSRMNLILEGTGLQFGEPGTGAMATSDFDHTRDAWWRIREFEGVTFVDTAPDGIAWVERMQIPTPFSLDHATFALGAGTYEVVNTPGRARFRCLNQPPPCS